jgi:hypothetical protein
MPRGQTSTPSWVRIGHQSRSGEGDSRAPRHISVIGGATVSGKLTCLPLTLPITRNFGYRRHILRRRIQNKSSLLRTLALCNRRAISEIVSQRGVSETGRVPEM